MAVSNDRQITLSTAGSRTSKLWQPQTLYWSELVERLRVAARGQETLEEYLRCGRARADRLAEEHGITR